MIERLEEHNHTFRYEHLCYEVAGYLTIPGFATEAKTKSSRHMKSGENRADNESADADSWPQVLGFLEEHLKERPV